MSAVLLRAYLLCGLVLHKVVWEWLRDRSLTATDQAQAPSLKIRLVKLAKIAVLGFLVAQTLIPSSRMARLCILEQPYPLEVLGLIIFTVGLVTAVPARLQLGPNWTDIETPAVGREQRVVSRGIYRFIRHPISLVSG